MPNNFSEWLYAQLVAVKLHLKMLKKEPKDGYANTVEYFLGYRDALRRAIKFYKTAVKEVE